VFASSSSVYGANTKVPFAVSDNVDHPFRFTPPAKANELIAHVHSHLHNLPATGCASSQFTFLATDMLHFKFVKAKASPLMLQLRQDEA